MRRSTLIILGITALGLAIYILVVDRHDDADLGRHLSLCRERSRQIEAGADRRPLAHRALHPPGDGEPEGEAGGGDRQGQSDGHREHDERGCCLPHASSLAIGLRADQQEPIARVCTTIPGVAGLFSDRLPR